MGNALEYEEVGRSNGSVAFKITHQDSVRDKFGVGGHSRKFVASNGLTLRSYDTPEVVQYGNRCEVYTRGNRRSMNDTVLILAEDVFDQFEGAVDEYNVRKAAEVARKKEEARNNQVKDRYGCVIEKDSLVLFSAPTSDTDMFGSEKRYHEKRYGTVGKVVSVSLIGHRFVEVSFPDERKTHRCSFPEILSVVKNPIVDSVGVVLNPGDFVQMGMSPKMSEGSSVVCEQCAQYAGQVGIVCMGCDSIQFLTNRLDMGGYYRHFKNTTRLNQADVAANVKRVLKELEG